MQLGFALSQKSKSRSTGVVVVGQENRADWFVDFSRIVLRIAINVYQLQSGVGLLPDNVIYKQRIHGFGGLLLAPISKNVL